MIVHDTPDARTVHARCGIRNPGCLGSTVDARAVLFLTRSANFWSTLSIVMHHFTAKTKMHTGIRGAVSISVIRIRGHNVSAGDGA